MRTLEQQGLNRHEDDTLITGTTKAYPFAQFKNESAYMAQDGTQLVEQNGLADVYYAMRHLLSLAAIEPNNLTEARAAHRLTNNKNHPSQIVSALFTLFASSRQIDNVIDALDAFRQNRYRRTIELTYTAAMSEYVFISSSLFGGMENVRALMVWAKMPSGYYRNFSVESTNDTGYAAGTYQNGMCGSFVENIALPLTVGTWKIYVTIETN